ncbi:hypothetical protein [Herbidospora yilanensis]|uniref:hypothetical protein n=1 Tax=Herbidospora yilanensis TaxID=354426 RepID=UPI000AC80A88|nr:hypothetical protein [Herbidospora yilanensis]
MGRLIGRTWAVLVSLAFAVIGLFVPAGTALALSVTPVPDVVVDTEETATGRINLPWWPGDLAPGGDATMTRTIKTTRNYLLVEFVPVILVRDNRPVQVYGAWRLPTSAHVAGTPGHRARAPPHT